jgi:hypothetical protein
VLSVAEPCDDQPEQRRRRQVEGPLPLLRHELLQRLLARVDVLCGKIDHGHRDGNGRSHCSARRPLEIDEGRPESLVAERDLDEGLLERGKVERPFEPIGDRPLRRRGGVQLEQEPQTPLVERERRRAVARAVAKELGEELSTLFGGRRSFHLRHAALRLPMSPARLHVRPTLPPSACQQDVSSRQRYRCHGLRSSKRVSNKFGLYVITMCQKGVDR